MENYFKDNPDIQFHLDHLDLSRVIDLLEDGFAEAGTYPEAPVDAADAVDNYRRVLGIVGEIAGGYVAPRARDEHIRLSSDKERSVGLLSMNANARREVQRQLDALIVSKGRQAVRTILDEYMTVMPGLEDWEVKGILHFARSYQLDLAEA